MKIRSLVSGILALVLAAIAAAPAFAQKNPWREAYFSQMHVHASWSLDAYIIGNTVTGPEDSHKYALGQPIKHPLSPSTLFAQIIESNPTPPIEENPTPPIEQNPTPPIEQDPRPPTEENPRPPIEEHPTPPMLKQSMRPADSSGVTHAGPV